MDSAVLYATASELINFSKILASDIAINEPRGLMSAWTNWCIGGMARGSP